MKKLIFIILFVVSSSFSQLKYDTLYSSVVSDGIKFNKLKESIVPWSVNVLEVDISNPNIRIETAKANDRLIGNETTSSMAKRRSTPNEKVIAAINGDFYYKGGLPTNLQIKNGQILTTPINRTILAFDYQNKPIIDVVKYEGKIITNKNKFEINGINITRDYKKIILYNKYYGDSTSTSSHGFEILVQRINNWMVNDTVKCVVKKIQVGLGNFKIPDTTFAVISSGDVKNDLIKHVKLNDTIKIFNSIKPAKSKIKEAIGGLIQLVKDGKNYVDKSFVEHKKPSFTYVRHPRTAVGFSKDSTKIFFVVVDGRQSTSAGMTLPELAELMLNVGSYNAINLDGGGSSTIYVDGEIKNNPSDGIERAVSNSILIIEKKKF
ncbi:MAG: phosphodiester glycosidase family protein [Melioribacteraceae bacterium]|nr:phosphodiester glycosidase family protein [Melioribacteraceae bacterium]